MSAHQTAFQSLEDPRQVDLGRHAWIEASAGTGKTYTIERIVIRGIVEERLPLGRILAVTFTEKATGELKDRIRTILEWIVASASSDRSEDADSRWLSEQYRLQGPSLMRRAVEALDRFDEASIFTIHGFCRSVLRDYAFDLGRLLQYELVDDRQILDEMIQQRYRRWPTEYGDRLATLLERGEFWRREHSSGGASQYHWDSLLRELALRYRPGDELRLPAIHDGSLDLLRDAVLQLQTDMQEYKAERGRISYDDMIRMVREAVTGPSAVAAALRERYRLAVVDEFQDTDSQQWDIFRTVFLSGRGTSLVLVGDPKQSIYGFRGADVHAYFRARDSLSDLALQGQAVLYRLERNYRSTERYVQACNGLFSKWKWAGGDNRNIEFTPSLAAGAWTGTNLPDGRFALNLWDEPGPGGTPGAMTAGNAARAFYRFVAREIRRLMDSGWVLTSSEGIERRFHYGDVAILVMKHSEGQRIMEEMRDAGIPASFYKQTGVFESREALEILYVLEAIANPGRSSAMQKGLLTRFFGFAPERLHELDELAVDDPILLRIQEWQELALQARWSLLFRSFIAHPDSPVARMAMERAPGWERSLTNFEQILLVLEEEGLRRGLDLEGMIRSLKYRMGGDADLAEEETLHRQETEDDCVRLLTMHASKGLEFPVVFVAGGMTGSARYAWYEFFEEGNRIYGLRPLQSDGDGGAEAEVWKALHKQRQEEEYARLYYVALTRAAIMAYIPFYRPKSGSGTGPLCSLVYESLKAVCPASLPSAERLSGCVSDGDVSVTQGSVQGDPARKSGQRRFTEVRLPPRLRQRRNQLHSYSSLSAHHSGVFRMDAEATERVDTSESEMYGGALSNGGNAGEPLQAHAPVSLSPSLDQRFRGATAGNLFHEILERLDYRDPAFRSEVVTFASLTAANQRLIRYRLRSYGYEGSAEEAEVTSLLARVLATELLPGFCLRDLSSEDRLHEMEFLLSAHPAHTSSADRASSGAEPRPEPMLTSRGSAGTDEAFLTGFIDLLFQYRGKVYLLDWKTNLLDAYDPASLHRCMRSMQYDLQYSLYAQAVNGWLHSARPGTMVDGIFYLFLRGMQPGSRNGIYFVQPLAEDLDRTVAGVLRS